MSLLSNRPIDWTNETFAEMRKQLVSAYSTPKSAMDIANEAGLDPGSFPLEDENMRQKWKGILNNLANQGKLRKLVEKILKDPTAEAYHEFFNQVLQQDDEEREKEAAAGNAAIGTISKESPGQARLDEYSFKEEHWEALLRNIEKGRCAPFIGPEIYSGDLPSKAELAEQWSEEHGYPLGHHRDLTDVAQYLSMQEKTPDPRIKIVEKLNYKKITQLNQMGRIFEVLARLPLPVYLTTNYDNFLFQALDHTDKEPVQEFCRWNDNLGKILSTYKADPGYRPTHKKPLVFNFFGCMEFERKELPQSLVITQDEYFSYLVNITKNPMLILPHVQEALATSSLLFLGYSLWNIEFRVLLQIAGVYLKDSWTTMHVCIQLDPGQEMPDPQKVRRFLGKYFGQHKLLVYWGPYQEFIETLDAKWEHYSRQRKFAPG